MALRTLTTIVLGLSLLSSGLAAETAALLGKRLLPRDLARKETMDYLEFHVADLPRLQSAEAWREYADNLREETLESIIFRGVPESWRSPEPRIEWVGEIPGGPGYLMKTLRYEALPGLWIPAVLYVPEKLSSKVPVVLNVNGHTPEGIAWEHYQARCINEAKRGMIALAPEWIGYGQMRRGFAHGRMNQLDLCGVSGVAVFYQAMARGIDVLLSLPNADPERLAVTGLSGGGWQTIILSSLDTRVKLSMPVAGYSGFRTRARQTWDLGDSEQAPVDLAMTADYTHLTCFLAPRPACLTYNAKDNCCFKAEWALQPLVEAASPVYQLLGAPERLRTHVNHDEGHNYGVDNRQTFYTMLRDFFYDGRADWNTTEIDSASEYKTPAELTVPVPEGNATFNSLARQLAQTLPRDATVPGEPAELAAWQNRKREELAQIVRWQDYEVKVVGSTPETAGPVAATWWRLATFDADETWTLCAVEVAKGEAKRTVMLVADGGHAGATREVEELVNAGARVFVVDPLFIGESAFDWNPVRYSVHISSSGGRPMGIQASQLAAVARWVKKERGAASLSLVSIGPRAGLAALVAAGLEPEAFAELETRGGMRTLQEIIEKDTSIDAEPTYFTFGLLEAFDIPQLSALVVPRPMAMK